MFKFIYPYSYVEIAGLWSTIVSKLWSLDYKVKQSLMGNIDYCYFHGSKVMVCNYIIYTVAEKYGLIKKKHKDFCFVCF